MVRKLERRGHMIAKNKKKKKAAKLKMKNNRRAIDHQTEPKPILFNILN